MALSENGIKLLDIVVKGGFGTLIAAGVAYYGTLQHETIQRQQDDNRQLQSTIELSSHQKEFDVDLGMRLFGTLMGSYFQNDTLRRPHATRQQLVLLRLVALNFEDVPLDLKPLYEDLDQRLSKPADRQSLRGIAREVSLRQAFRMTANDAYDSGPREVRSGDSLSIPELLITIRWDVNAEGVHATVFSDVGGSRSVGPFEVTSFDEPLVDNILLGDFRVALLLLDSTRAKARVRIIGFPRHLAADRFDIKDMSRVFRDRN